MLASGGGTLIPADVFAVAKSFPDVVPATLPRRSVGLGCLLVVLGVVDFDADLFGDVFELDTSG